MKKLTLAVAIALFATPALSDTIRTSDGISCSFDSDDSPYEVRTYAESGANEYDQNGSNDYYNGYDGNDNRVGIEFTWKLELQNALIATSYMHWNFAPKKQK